MRIRLLGNTGLAFNIGDKKLMIDGLYDDKSGFFSSVPWRILKPMLNGVGEYSHMDYILFTHDHSDHFNAEQLRLYLKRNHVVGTFLPDTRGIIKDFERIGYNRIMNLMPDLYTRMRLGLNEDFTIDYFRVPHIGKDYGDIPNICYIIEYEGYKVLVTADGDFNIHYYQGLIEKGEIHVIVVNPVFYNNEKGIELIEHFQIPNVIVYHIPFKEDDKNGLRNLVAEDIKKNENKSFKTIAFMEREASVWIR